jgi:dUTP pyrophosphatase
LADVKIHIFRNNKKAKMPKVAYNNTSAAFDLVCTETTTIKAKESAIVPNGLNIVIDENDPYWMHIQLRSSLGFKNELMPHAGVVDAGYTGDFGVKVYNVGNSDYTIKEGEAYAQVTVHHKPTYELAELNREQFLALKAKQGRGDKGFGSSNEDIKIEDDGIVGG